jgi:VWFA-related protein
MRVGLGVGVVGACVWAAAGALAAAQGPVLRTKPAAKDSGDAKDGAAAKDGAGETSAPAAAPVSFPLVLRDRKGGLVSGLNKANFTLQVDSKPETVGDVRPASGPLVVGLLVDASVSERDAIEEERKAGKAFLDAVVGSGEGKSKGFVVQFARQADLLQDVTASVEGLDAAVTHLETVEGSKGQVPKGGSASGVDPGTGKSQGQRGATTLYDAVFLSSDEVVKTQAGRHVLVVISDGDDSGSKESVGSAIEAAQRANAVMYTVYIKGHEETQRGFHNGNTQIGMGPDPCDPMGYPGGGYPGGYPAGGWPGGRGGGRNVPTPDGKKVLERMAKMTGGRMFDGSHRGGLDGILKEIREELAAEYTVTFTPDKRAAEDGYHRLEMEVTGAGANAKELSLEFPDGYYEGTP